MLLFLTELKLLKHVKEFSKHCRWPTVPLIRPYPPPPALSEMTTQLHLDLEKKMMSLKSMHNVTFHLLVLFVE